MLTMELKMDSKREVDLTLIKENEDGSAVYNFDFSDEELTALTRLGIITALKAGLDEAKKYDPDYVDQEKNALELQGLVKEFFEKYLNRIEESDSGNEFSPITVSCCRAAMLEPLNNLLDKMCKLAGAKSKITYELGVEK